MPPQTNLNVPSCAGGCVRDPVVTVMSPSGNADADDNRQLPVDIHQLPRRPERFEIGYALLCAAVFNLRVRSGLWLGARCGVTGLQEFPKSSS